MPTDKYTRVILTVIAIMLTVLACGQYINPRTTAQAQGAFAGVQFTGGAEGFSTFDPRTGDIWSYYSNGKLHGPMERAHAKLSAPGGSATFSAEAK